MTGEGPEHTTWQESVGAYMDFMNSMFSFYQQGIEQANRQAQQGLDQAQRQTQS